METTVWPFTTTGLKERRKHPIVARCIENDGPNLGGVRGMGTKIGAEFPETENRLQFYSVTNLQQFDYCQRKPRLKLVGFVADRFPCLAFVIDLDRSAFDQAPHVRCASGHAQVDPQMLCRRCNQRQRPVGVCALGAVVLYGATGWLWLVVHEGLRWPRAGRPGQPAAAY